MKNCVAYVRERLQRNGKMSQKELTSKRPPIDRCNICGKMDRLTDDHVPPKFWHNSSNKRYSQGLGTYDPEKTSLQFPWTARGGIVFRSICSDCNNRVLGSDTDKPLKDFCDQIRSNLKAGNNYINCRIKPNRIARAVLGHMLAAKDFFDDSCLVDKALREYVLDPDSIPPENLSLLYFVYPYNTIVIGRDIAVKQVTPKLFGSRVPDGMISCLYSYPVGFLLVDSGQNLYLRDMFEFCTKDIDEERDILCTIDSHYYYGTKIPRDPLWPINVSDDIDGTSFLIAGQAMKRLIVAVGKD